jgi:hypothetical protein
VEDVGVYPKSPNDKLYDFKIGGFYRFFSTYATFQDPYILDAASGVTTPEHTLFVGDDAQLPNLQLNISGRPNDRASWGFDLYVFQFLNGLIGSTYGNQVVDSLRPSVIEPLGGTRLAGNMNLLLGLNLFGSYASPIGNFDIKVGGIHWTSISDLTMGTTLGYNRYNLFERNPWDPLDRNLKDRYQNYYEYGNINQDARWGEQAFSGIIIDGIDLPSNVSFRAMYGKTALDGGFYTIPNLSYGGRIRKGFADGSYIGINTFNNRTFQDSLNNAAIGFNVITAEFKKNFKNQLTAQLEAGAGRYINSGNKLPWGEAIDLKLWSKEELTGIPLNLHFYRIGPEVINNNAVFNNTSVQEAIQIREQTSTANLINPNLLRPFASSIVTMGQMTNNRQTVELNGDVDIQNLSLSAGISYGSELQADSNNISYGHQVNTLTRSRFWRWNFPANVGPYGRENVVYRSTYEVAGVYNGTDTLTRERAFNKKHFNNLEVQMRYKIQLFNRNLYAFYLGRMATAQDKQYAVIPYSDAAYIRTLTNELELYYELNPKWMMCLYLGLEEITGNEYTDLNSETGKPRDQHGKGIGLGTDLTLSKNAGLFIRHRWAFYEDRNFPLDQFNMQETMVELKISF